MSTLIMSLSVGRSGNAVMRPSVCLSHVVAQNGVFYGCGYYRTLIGNPTLEVELTRQRRRLATGNGRNGRVHNVSRHRGDSLFALVTRLSTEQPK